MMRGKLVRKDVLAATVCVAAGVLAMGRLMMGAAPSAAEAGVVLAAASASAPGMEPLAMGRTPMRRASFTWTGSGGNDNWNTSQNWSGAGGACPYPCGSTDDATFTFGDDVTFDAGRTIDDLTIGITGENGGATTFDAGGNVRTLTCDTVTLSAPGAFPLTFTVTGKARVETN